MKTEGLIENVYLVGDPRFDALCYYRENETDQQLRGILDFDNNRITLPNNYYNLTCYRKEHTGKDNGLLEIKSNWQDLVKKRF